MALTQTRTIDPYASYNSNIANRLTRIITDGVDCILYPSLIEVEIVTTTTINVTAGRCVKDDVVIETGAYAIDMTAITDYISGAIWDETGYYYVVLDYQYQKVQPANTASIFIIKPSEIATLYDSDDHLLIACLEVSGSYQVDAVWTYDPSDLSVARVLKGIDPNLGLISILEKSSAYTADPSDGIILVTLNTTITLPAITVSTKEIRIIKGDSSATTTTVDCSGADTIEGDASIDMTGQWNEITVIPNSINNVWVEV